MRNSDKLHAEVSKFVSVFEKAIPQGVNDQIVRDHLTWITRHLTLLNSEAKAQDKFELWCQIANRLNLIKNIILDKNNQIPSFNQVQAKQFEEYSVDMRHAFPYVGPGDAIPDIQSYKLTQEQYEKMLKEFFPYYEELQTFIRSPEFENIFDVIKAINQTLKESYPDMHLELLLHNHLQDKKLDKKSTEQLLRKNITEILRSNNPPGANVILIKQEIINVYYAARKSQSFFQRSSFAQALEDFINFHILENINKVPHVVKAGEEPPTVESLLVQGKSGLERRP